MEEISSTLFSHYISGGKHMVGIVQATEMAWTRKFVFFLMTFQEFGNVSRIILIGF